MPPSFSCTDLAEEIEIEASISIPFLVCAETVEDPMLAEDDPSSEPVCRTSSELYQSKILNSFQSRNKLARSAMPRQNGRKISLENAKITEKSANGATPLNSLFFVLARTFWGCSSVAVSIAFSSYLR